MQENILNQKSVIMNSEDKKYNELIHQIKALEVKMPNSQDFTEKTMSAIELLPQKKSSNKFLSILSVTSSMAASFLIGLFVFEQLETPQNIEFTSSKIMPVSVSPIYKTNGEELLTMNDFNCLLNSIKEQRKKQQSLNLIINKYKTL